MREIARPRWVVAAAFILVVGYALGRWPGAALGLATLVAGRGDARRLVRAAGVGSAALLSLAAVATVSEGIGRATARFADDRPTATSASLLAGLLLLVAVVGLVLDDRDRATARAAPDRGSPSPRAGWISGLADARWALPALTAAAARWIARPDALSPLGREVARNIDLGIAVGRAGADGVVRPSAWVAPLAPIVDALLPMGGAFWNVVAGATTAVLVAVLGRRLFGDRCGLVAGVAYGLIPSVANQSLASSLAALLVMVGLVLLTPGQESEGDATRLDRSTRHPASFGVKALKAAGLVGGALALAALARPEVLLLALVWAVIMGPRWRGAVLVGVVLIVIAPWSLWVNQHFDTWWPTTSATSVVAAADDAAAGPGTRVAPDPPEPGDAERLAHREGRRSMIRNVGSTVRPDYVVARLLRSVDLWAPGPLADSREARDQPASPAVWAWPIEVAVWCAAVAGAVRLARLRRLPGLLAAPLVLYLGLSGLLDGDAALRSWAAPAMVLIAVAAWIPTGANSERPDPAAAARAHNST